MSEPIKFVAFCGSLRKASFNRMALQAFIERLPAGASAQIIEIDWPLYNADIQAQGFPDKVQAAQKAMIEADGLVLVTPEYNSGIPGVFKNAIDWLSRPDADIARVFGGRRVAVIGASPGGFGTLLSQTAWLPVLKTLGTLPWFGARLQVSRARDVFDGDGNLVDARVREQLTKFLAGFAAFCGK